MPSRVARVLLPQRGISAISSCPREGGWDSRNLSLDEQERHGQIKTEIVLTFHSGCCTFNNKERTEYL